MPDYFPLFRSFLTQRSKVHFAYDLTAGQVLYVGEDYKDVTGDPASQVQED